MYLSFDILFSVPVFQVQKHHFQNLLIQLLHLVLSPTFIRFTSLLITFFGDFHIKHHLSYTFVIFFY